MSPTADKLREYLGPEEPVVARSAGTLSEKSAWNPVSVGLTDRRLLCVAEDGRFVTAGYDAICTIRSRPRTTHTYRGTDHRLLLGMGGLGALLGGIGVLAHTTSVLVFLLGLVTVGGLLVAEYSRRNADELGWETVAEVTDHVPYDGDGTAVRRWYARAVPDAANEHQVLMLGSGALAVVSFAGLVLLASSWLVVAGVLAVVGGSALAEYAYRHAETGNGIEIVRHREMEVSISTDADRTIHLRCDPTEEFVQELSRAAFVDDLDASQLVSPRS